MAAAAPQQQVTQERDVVIGGDGLVAVRATGARRDDRLVARKAMNADVQEAADDEAIQEYERFDHSLGYRLPCKTDRSLAVPRLRFLRLRSGQERLGLPALKLTTNH